MTLTALTSWGRKGTLTLWVVVFIIVFLATGALTVRRSLKGSNDFDTYYQAGRAVLTGQGIYYIDEYYLADEQTSPFLYSPVAACFFALLAWLPLAVSAFVWNAINLFLYGVCFLLVFAFLGVPLSQIPDLWYQSPKPLRSLVVIMGIALLADNLSMAQINIFTFFIIMLCLVLWKEGKPLLSGVFLAVAILIKLTPAFFCLFFAMKKSWKVLAGCLVGLIFFTIVLPNFIFGFDNNRIYHRQWLGRTIKPLAVSLKAKLEEGEVHPLKKTAEKISQAYLAQLLLDKNQSLEAALTRLFLKDRNSYAYDTAYPVYAARRYESLPILFGGLERKALNRVIRVLQVFLLFFLLFLLGRFPGKESSSLVVLEVSLIFLSLSFFSPIVRSHRFVPWLFVYLSALWVIGQGYGQAIRRRIGFALTLASTLYGLQVVPYGKAFGMGAWANIVLWLGLVASLLKMKFIRNKGLFVHENCP